MTARGHAICVTKFLFDVAFIASRQQVVSDEDDGETAQRKIWLANARWPLPNGAMKRLMYCGCHTNPYRRSVTSLFFSRALYGSRRPSINIPDADQQERLTKKHRDHNADLADTQHRGLEAGAEFTLSEAEESTPLTIQMKHQLPWPSCRFRRCVSTVHACLSKLSQSCCLDV